MNVKILLPVFVIVLFSGFTALAQDKKADTILKINGDELQGSVKEISSSSIKFSYIGEELTYELPKSEIIKITFAS